MRDPTGTESRRRRQETLDKKKKEEEEKGEEKSDPLLHVTAAQAEEGYKKGKKGPQNFGWEGLFLSFQASSFQSVETCF